MFQKLNVQNGLRCCRLPRGCESPSRRLAEAEDPATNHVLLRVLVLLLMLRVLALNLWPPPPPLLLLPPPPPPLLLLLLLLLLLSWQMARADHITSFMLMTT